MGKDEIAAVFERVKTWPEQRQEEAAELLLALEAAETEPVQLSHSERADLETAVEEMERGEVASPMEVAAVFRRR
jgi:hypothetical protein